jgi:hypothetical protein
MLQGVFPHSLMKGSFDAKRHLFRVSFSTTYPRNTCENHAEWNLGIGNAGIPIKVEPFTRTANFSPRCLYARSPDWTCIAVAHGNNAIGIRKKEFGFSLSCQREFR